MVNLNPKFVPEKRQPIPKEKLQPKEHQVNPDLRERAWSPAEELEAGVPGLHKRLSWLKPGEDLYLSDREKEFLTKLIMENPVEVYKFIADVAQRIWGVRFIEWKESGQRSHEEIYTALSPHFFKSDMNIEHIAPKVVDFYLGNTRLQALKEISEWPDWRNRTLVS